MGSRRQPPVEGIGRKTSMAKPELGTKRRCANCGAAYYDLNREPIICPKCNTEFVVEQPKPARRKREPEPAKPVAKPVVEEGTAALGDDDEEDFLADDDIDEDDDVGEVIAGDDEDSET